MSMNTTHGTSPRRQRVVVLVRDRSQLIGECGRRIVIGRDDQRQKRPRRRHRAGHSGPGAVKSQGITSFGGTWYVLNASGSPVTAKAASSPSSGGGGYGY
jgi:hypothetical protein